ncbi:ATP-binding protein [Alloscardovia macacae]|uniref:ATPase n=1 Tax=Alloscardovia macacae TaxID=1160091 RepID=A0A261F283_9BIFI|nr:AAA family ATPase [Alloscardovia macacae]OZG53208.1 ATPase [Alloscardovia macacae]
MIHFSLIARCFYISFLLRHQNKPIIKVLHGVRGVGKSTILNMYRDELRVAGVDKQHIIVVDCEEKDTYECADVFTLNKYIESLMMDDSLYYVFLDEVQKVKGYELLLGSLFIKPNVDLYVASSSGEFLRGTLSTNLTGRYLQKEVFPLSFAEYVSASDSVLDLKEMFREYQYSAFPYLRHTRDDVERINYLENLYDTICANDGDEVLAYSIPRYDIKKRTFLRGSGKEYVIDLGMKGKLDIERADDVDYELKNIVCLELRRRFAHVYAGVIGDSEIDFVAMGATGEREYYQVESSPLSEEDVEHKLKSLATIEDQYPQYMLTMDRNTQVKNYGGIRVLSIVDWLLESC